MMFLVGIGLDLIDLTSFEQLYGQAESDLTRVFVVEEIAFAGNNDGDRIVRLAARFAAKEAALKALGCGLQDGIALTDIVVIRDQVGPPRLELREGALEEARRRHVDAWLLSLTHTETAAAAVAVALSSGASTEQAGWKGRDSK